MSRPDERSLHKLPLLAPRQTELETCVFCPKLCRSACPVSNAEPRETLTPWGKMATAYHLARADVEPDPSFVLPAWACTGCRACTRACDHGNDVTGTLLTARAALRAADMAPPSTTGVVAGFAAQVARADEGAGRVAARTGLSEGGQVGLLVGCGYLRDAEDEACDAAFATLALTSASVTLVGGCCGLPLLHAGDEQGFVDHLEQLASRAARFSRLVVLDAGCAQALRVEARTRGVQLPVLPELLVEIAARELARIEPLGSHSRVRYHDPCQLGRGLGVYEAPRAVLTRLFGVAPSEFEKSREGAGCSGAGGLLPVTYPEVSRDIASERVRQHTDEGGGRIVTACASSLKAFRRAGADADDLVTWLARGLGSKNARG